MPIYTDDPCNDGLFPVGPFLRSSIGIGPKVTKIIDAATKDWLDEHPEATTTVANNSLNNMKFMDGSVNSRVIEDESITTDDIADLAVTTPKIANNAVTADKIASAAADGLRTMNATQPGVAKVGAGLAINNGALELNGGSIAPAVTAWLNAHPEATTTVTDGSVDDDKLVQTGGVLDHVDAIDNYIFDIFDNGTTLADISGITVMTGFNAAPQTSTPSCINTNIVSTFDTYYFIASSDLEIYVDSVSAGYFAILYGSDYTGSRSTSEGGVLLMCSNPTRVRKSENNLPTVDNKLSISAGSVVAFTITAGATQVVYGFGAIGRVVKESFKEEVTSRIKMCNLRYITQSGNNPEVVQVFVPVSVGYVRYDFAHTVIPSINCDVWRVDMAYSTTDEFVERFALTTGGEWECALHLKDAPDFSGGRAHGDEVMSSIVFLLDGELVDITELTDMTSFDSLVVAQVSTLYDPNDSVTEVAHHGSEHVFSTDGLTINQTVTWSVAEELGPCYMAMLPAAKAVTNRVFTDKDYVTTVADGTRQAKTGAKSATLYSTDSGVTMQFSIDQYPEASGGSASDKKLFLLTDNTSDQSGSYNKCYFVITADTSGAVTSSIGEEWKTTTLYEIHVGK